MAAGVPTGSNSNTRTSGDSENALSIIDAANASNLRAAQKSAVEGWAKTWYALDLLYLIQTRDSIGVPTEIPSTPSTPAPFVARAQVYQRIIATLESL